MGGFIYELFKKEVPIKSVTCVRKKHKVLVNIQTIKEALSDLMLAKTALSLLVAEFKKPVVSYILSIDADSLYFDLLKDQAMHQALIDAETFRVIAKQAHIDFIFDTRVICFKDGDMAYRVKFPEKIYHPQRREAFRLTLPEQLKLSIDLALPDSETVLVGKLINLSVTGAAFIISSEFNAIQGSILENCLLHLPGNIDIRLDIKICTIKYLRFNRVGIRVGCSFLALKPGIDQMLTKFITHCELRMREVRRKSKSV